MNSMKTFLSRAKSAFFLCILFFVSSAYSQTIAVPEPTAVNVGDDASWLVPFVQSVITTNFKKYSSLSVLDVQNIGTIISEQKRAESGAYSDNGADLRGQLSNANLTVTGTIVKKASSYSLSFNITDTRTGESKASAVIANCLFSALENGEAANRISYDLMKNAGIALSATAEKELTEHNSVLSSEMSAQISRAKGIAAEASGSNIEALTYYIQAQKRDSKNVDVSARIAAMSTVISNGNFGSEAKNLIKMREEWDKLLSEAASLIAQNHIQLTLVYKNDIIPREDTMTEEDYINHTMSFSIPTPHLEQFVNPDNEKMANELLTALHKIPQSKNWGAKINGFPWTYANDFAGNNYLKKALEKQTETLTFAFSLVNPEKNKVIGKRSISFTVAYAPDFSDVRITNRHVDSKGNEWTYLGFTNVSVEDADTPLLTIRVENTSGQAVSIMTEDIYLSQSYPSSSSALFPVVYAKANNAVDIIKKLVRDSTIRLRGEMTQAQLKEIGAAVANCKYKIELDLSAITGLFGTGRYDKDISSIPTGVFGYTDCTSLVSITIPDNPNPNGKYSNINAIEFWTCINLVAINATEKNIKFVSKDGCLYTKDMKTFLAAPPAVTSVKIASGVTEIEGIAFYQNKSITMVEIPVSVQRIGYAAFKNCTNLVAVKYAGTKKEWGKIKITKDDKGNKPLIDAAKKCIK